MKKIWYILLSILLFASVCYAQSIIVDSVVTGDIDKLVRWTLTDANSVEHKGTCRITLTDDPNVYVLSKLAGWVSEIEAIKADADDPHWIDIYPLIGLESSIGKGSHGQILISDANALCGYNWTAPPSGSGTPADTVTAETSFGASSNAGAATTYSRGDHTHGTPVNPVTGHEATYNHSLLHSNTNDPSADQKAALAGTSGAPSATNKYVTNDDARNTNARTPTAHDQAATTITSGTLDGDRLPALSSSKRGGVPATGTPSGKYLRDDDTWQTVSGGSPPAGVLDDIQISVLQSDGTLNAASGVQTWCGTNKTGQDVFTVTANTTYLVRGQYKINTGATTHTTAMAWALSGATVASVEYNVLLWAAAANTITTTQSTVQVSGVASKVLNATGTAVYTIIQFEGIFVTTNGGTITPQINFSANPTGTNLMKRGSWVSFSKIGADTVTLTGGWS